MGSPSQVHIHGGASRKKKTPAAVGLNVDDMNINPAQHHSRDSVATKPTAAKGSAEMPMATVGLSETPAFRGVFFDRIEETPKVRFE